MPGRWVNPRRTHRALYLSKVPSGLNLCLKTHLPVTTFARGGRGRRSQVLLARRAKTRPPWLPANLDQRGQHGRCEELATARQSERRRASECHFSRESAWRAGSGRAAREWLQQVMVMAGLVEEPLVMPVEQERRRGPGQELSRPCGVECRRCRNAWWEPLGELLLL
jgi:hypothetical protein